MLLHTAGDTAGVKAVEKDFESFYFNALVSSYLTPEAVLQESSFHCLKNSKGINNFLII